MGISHREELELHCVHYCSKSERRCFAVSTRGDGLLRWSLTGGLVGPPPEGERQIFVITIEKQMYIGPKVKGFFHHSSFNAGRACIGAGYVVVKFGKLEEISPHSGHYRPTEINYQVMLDFI